jgi:branched-chain amino acid transport system substrate-binding protein
MDRRALFGLLASAGLAGLTPACKKKDDGGGGSGNGPSRSETGDIVIGHYASMTGNTAHFGQDTDKAARLAAEQLNAAGGVLGRKLKIVTLDTRGDGSEAANAVTRLIDVEKASAILGEVASSLSLQGGPIAQRRKIPMVSPSSTNPKVTQVGDYVFRVCYIDPFQGKVMAVFTRKTLKFDKVAILKDVKNDYSIGLAEAFQKSFTAEGGSIAIEQSYSAGDTDFSAQVTAIKNSGAQAIWVPGYYTEVGAIARTAARLGVKVPLLGGDGWDAPELFTIGGDALNGSYFSNHFAPDQASPQAQKFVADFKAKYGQEPTGLGALGYDGVMVIADAIKRAGKVEPAAMRDALAATKDYESVTGKITMDKDRNPEKSVVVLKIEGAKAKYEALVNP